MAGTTGVHAPGRVREGASGSFATQGLLPEMKAIADTGFLVAFANRADSHHDWALSVAQRITEPLLTCDAVLAETTFHLGNASLVLSFIKLQMVRPAFNLAEHLERLMEIAKRYADRQPDLADLCLIRMSELHPRHSVITTDRKDFSVYRRGLREAIPLECPPARG